MVRNATRSTGRASTLSPMAPPPETPTEHIPDAALSLPLAGSERLRPLAEVVELSTSRPRAAYLHVPFCRHKCHYCDFYSFVDTQERAGAFVDRLEAELAAVGRQLPADLAPLEAVFIGGGTPTLLPPPLLRRVLAAVRRELPLATDLEWTVEANPETVDAAIAETLAAGGVNRASLGAQSFSPQSLAALERDHRIESVGAAIDHLRAAGISNLNLDLIFAVPGSTLDAWRADLDAALALAPQHLSAYGLMYEPNTPLAVREARGEVVAIDEEIEAEMYTLACDRLAAAGFERYEVSNWALPGRACRHNLLYWRNASWLAFGPSASGHLNGVRFKVVPRLGDWLAWPGTPPLSEWERLDESGTFGEELMLGLRLAEGLDAAWLDRGLAAFDATGARRSAIAVALGDGRLEAIGGRIRLTHRGTLLANTLLAELV